MEKRNTLAIITFALFVLFVGSKITQIKTSTDEQICNLDNELEMIKKKYKEKREELAQEIEDLRLELALKDK